MPSIRQTMTRVRYAFTNTTIVLVAVLLTAFGAAALGIQYQASQANVQAANCSDNDIVRCGVHNYDQLTKAYDDNRHGDVKAIFDHYWIKRTLPAGAQVFDGQANPDGTVTANGRVVAKNASSIGRQAIKHSRPIAINGKTYYETSHVGGQAFANPNASLAALVVLDGNGNFLYALVKACGNPIYATPVPPPPAPEPEPKMIEVCELATKKVITIKEEQFDNQKHSKNLADCQEVMIEVCELETKTVITINEADFDSQKHSKNLADCKEEPVLVEVCDTELNKIVTVSEETAKDERYSTNLDDCQEKVAPPVETPEEPTPAPQELPTTGAGSMLSAVLGLTSMSLAIYYFALSRRP